MAGKGSDAKRESASKAARARWKNHRKRPVALTVEGTNVLISRHVPRLKEALSTREGHSDGSKIKWERASYLFKADGKEFTPLTLLHRVREFLRRENITCKVVWNTKPFYQRMNLKLSDALADYKGRQFRLLKRIIKEPAGALCRATVEHWDWLLVEVLSITRPARAVIVVEKVDRLHALHVYLRHYLREPIGVLTNQATADLVNQERVVIMVPQYIGAGIIPPDECEIVIFDRCPRSSFTQAAYSQDGFPAAWRMARLGDEKRGHSRMLAAESFFGPLVDVSKVLGASGK